MLRRVQPSMLLPERIRTAKTRSVISAPSIDALRYSKRSLSEAPSTPSLRRASELAGPEPPTIPDVTQPLNRLCRKSHPATPIVLV